jgi:hypothetical protein
MKRSPSPSSGDPWKTADPYYPAPKGAVRAAESEVQASFRFIVRRESQAEPSATHVLNTWVSTSYLIWAICVSLANDGVDEEWTRMFEKWRMAWKRIQHDVEYFEDGSREFVSNKFFLKIPPPPIYRVLVQQFDGPRFFPLRAGHFLEHCTGCSRCHGDGHHHEDMWGLWRYIHKAPVDSPLIFCVTLQENERVKSARFEDGFEVSPEIGSTLKLKQLPKIQTMTKAKKNPEEEESPKTERRPRIVVYPETKDAPSPKGSPTTESTPMTTAASKLQVTSISRKSSKLRRFLKCE